MRTLTASIGTIVLVLALADCGKGKENKPSSEEPSPAMIFERVGKVGNPEPAREVGNDSGKQRVRAQKPKSDENVFESLLRQLGKKLGRISAENGRGKQRASRPSESSKRDSFIAFLRRWKAQAKIPAGTKVGPKQIDEELSDADDK